VIRQLHQWKDRKKIVEVPVFSNYLFVEMYGSAEEQLCILQTVGAVRILGTGRDIERIPKGDLEAVRILVDSGVALLPHPFLKEGTRIRVTRGALEGVEGLLVKVKNTHRVVVSIHLLSQSVAAEIDAHSIEVVRPIAGNFVRPDHGNWSEARVS
jgi:transcription antitermination factor NusG